jgi:U3 small nucleolar RNA-associated protein 13
VAISQRADAYSSRQAFAVSAAGDKILKKWSFLAKDKAAGAERSIVSTFSIRAHDKDINSVTISPNDAVIASGSQDKTIRLWKSEDLTPMATLSGHKRGVWKVVFSPVDRTLCSSSGDKTLRIWSMVDYSCLRTFEGHTASVLSCKFIAHGAQILSGSADGLVRLWDVRTGECVNTFDQHEDKIWTIAVPNNKHSVGSDDGQMTFYSGGSDARILTWLDSTKEEEDKRLKETERYLLQEQQLANDIRNKRFGKVRCQSPLFISTRRTVTPLMPLVDGH